MYELKLCEAHFIKVFLVGGADSATTRNEGERVCFSLLQLLINSQYQFCLRLAVIGTAVPPGVRGAMMTLRTGECVACNWDTRRGPALTLRHARLWVNSDRAPVLICNGDNRITIPSPLTRKRVKSTDMTLLLTLPDDMLLKYA